MATAAALFLAISLPWGAQAQGALATAHPEATRIGAKVLEGGGNAIDAAVAVTAALAVAEPYSSGIGGGGFYLLYLAEAKRYVFIDARERAPLAASRDMYLDEKGEVVGGLSIDGALAAAIPGIPAALEHLSERYGSVSLAKLLAPAIRMAKEGVAVDKIYSRLAQFRRPALEKFPASRKIFLRDGQVPAIGEIYRQADLARVLEAIGKHGADGFYKGAVAKKLIASVRRHGGIWTKRDLAKYRIVEREPLRWQGEFGEFISAPPPSSGGIALAQILGQLDSLASLENIQWDSALSLHPLIEAMRRAYRDRAVYLGDPDFVDIPQAMLTSPDYTAGLAASIHLGKASRSEWLQALPSAKESPHTTHFSIIDRQGNLVSATLSINYPFGSGLVAEGTGVLLNNEMDDFSAKPGAENVYGLIGSGANAIAPGKRMLSSMSPTILRTPQRTMVIGTPGGSRIITMVALALLGAIGGQEAQDVVKMPRLHHQFVPDTVFLEQDFPDDGLVEKLETLGHRFSRAENSWGNMQVAVLRKDGSFSAASDPRGIGAAWIGKSPPD